MDRSTSRSIMVLDSDEFSTVNETLEIAHVPRTHALALEIQDTKGVRNIVVQDEQLIFGSSPKSDVVVHDPHVSGSHCHIGGSAAGIVVRDLGSRNHTYVNGARVADAVLCAGMTIVIGHTTIMCSVPEEDEGDAAPPVSPLDGVAGSSLVMRRVASIVRRFASLSLPVLVAGETGVGKELVARALHREGGRRDGPFVALNVASLPRELVESELFGHERGSFTGATTARAGAFEQAEGGTLFLDEIGELPIDAQPKLLRALDGYEIRRIGSAGSGQRRSTRVIAATHVPLLDYVEAGRFRKDLYHRLAGFIVEIPPLRERRGDIGAIAEQMLRRMEEEVGYKRLTPGALAALAEHPWPGNVRELYNVLHRAAVLASTAWIGPTEAVRALRRPSVRPAVRKVSERTVHEWLRQHEGNVSAAARAAGMPRTSFRKLLGRREA